MLTSASAIVHFFAQQYNRKGLYSNQIIIGFGLTEGDELC